jgi:hypothetical protein
MKPHSVKLIELALQACCASNTEKNTGMADMINFVVFFSCCSGKHTVTFKNKPFKFSRIQFYQDNKPVPTLSSKLLQAVGFLAIIFDTQKWCKG